MLLAAWVEEDLQALAPATEHATRAAAEASKAGDDNLLYQALIAAAYLKTETGQALDALGLCDAAEAVAARGLPASERVFVARGGALAQLGRGPEAIVQYQRAMAILEPAAVRSANARGELAAALGGLGVAYLVAGDPEHAVAAHTRGLALVDATSGPLHPDAGRMRISLARDETARGRFDDAAQHAQRGRELLAGALGAGHPEVNDADLVLVSIALHQGKTLDARRVLESVRARLAVARPGDVTEAFIEAQLGTLDQQAHHCDQALPHYQRELQVLLANHVDGADLANAEIDLANCLLETGQLLDAKARAEAALERLIRNNSPEPDRVLPWMILAMVADHRHDRSAAIGFARHVVAATTDADVGERAEVRSLMQTKLRGWGAL